MQTTTNSASSTPQIPYDLVREILEQLEDDKPSLCAVSLASTTLCQEAQSIIFRDVTTLTTETKHINFLQTVAASPSRLALLVRAYRIARVNMPRELSARIREALLAMCNLKYLGVYYVGHEEMERPNGPAAVLRGCAFKLKRFQWISDSSEAPELFATFLPQQESLQHISLQFTHPTFLENIRPGVFTMSLCPQLVSLVATWDVIKILLQGHEITTLTVLDSYLQPSTNIDVQGLALPLKHVKVLSYQFTGCTAT